VTSSTFNYFQFIGFLEFDVVCSGTIHRSLLHYLVQPALDPLNFLPSANTLHKEFQSPPNNSFKGYFTALHRFLRKTTCKLPIWQELTTDFCSHYQTYRLYQSVCFTLCAFKKILDYLYSLKFNFSTSTLNQKYCSRILAYYNFPLKLAYF